MSRIGNAIITTPSGVKVEQLEGSVKITGSKGEIILQLPVGIDVAIETSQITVKKPNDKNKMNLQGLTRSLLNNAVLGVSQGWSKKLQLVGVGYKAQTTGNELTLNVGFTHQVKIQAPKNISFAVEENTKITVSGIDKKEVGEITAQIRHVKPPEPYKGKGIRYLGEVVRKKAGKAVKAVGAA